MNVTNLRLVMPVAEQAYQLLTEFRNRYIEERHLPNSELTLVQAYLLAKLSVCLPAYLARRKYNPLRDGSLQAVETACYMVGGAPYLLVRQLMVRGNSTPLKPQPWSGRQLYELSDASGVLISIRRSACPAAARLIADLYDVIMNGTYKKPIDSPEVSRARHEIGDWRQFYNYTLAASRLELLLKLSQAITAKTLLLHREKNGLKQGSTSSGLERALQNALALSHAKISDEKDAHLILDNIINVLCALLKDHGESDTLIKLQCNDTSMPDAAFQIIFSDCGGELLRQRLQVLKEACSREMTAVHNALQRPNWGSFTDRDFYKRTAGGEFQDLVYTL